MSTNGVGKIRPAPVKRSTWSTKRLYLWYGPALALIIGSLAVAGVFHLPDLFARDVAFNIRGPQTPHSDITVVAVSQQDFEQGAPRWPWPRSLVARLIDQISAYEPAVIATDILYTEKTTTEALLTKEAFPDVQPYLYHILSGAELTIQTPDGTIHVGPGTPGFDLVADGATRANEQDRELADAVQRSNERGVPVVLAAQAISEGNVVGLSVPYADLSAAASGRIGLVGVQPDADGKLRRYIPYGRDSDGKTVYGMALAAVSSYLKAPLPASPKSNGDVEIGSDVSVPVDDGAFMVNFRGPSGTYPTLMSLDLLLGGQDYSSLLTGKIVILGVTDPAVHDVYNTPFAAVPTAGVEFQAAAVDTLLSGSFIGTAPGVTDLVLILVLGAAAIAMGRFLRPALGFAGVVGLVGVLGALWFFAFSLGDLFIPVVAPLTAIGIGYLCAVADRSLVEQLEKLRARSTLSKYLTPAIVDEMLRSPTESLLGGNRSEITILFSDIRGFTTTSEQLTPEQVVELLNEYLTIMTEVVFKYEGTVDKFEGDAILAFFGAPKKHDDDPDRAVQTAIEMRDKLADFQERWQLTANTPIRIGVGINTGQAVVGNIGSERRMDYTIIGDAVNLASRIQDLTKEHGVSILISENTRTALKQPYQLNFVGTTAIRGREQSVGLYEVVGNDLALVGVN